MATIISAADGLWSATATWTGGVLPAAGDIVTVRHKVTYDLNDSTATKVYARINVESSSLYATGSITQNGTTVTGSGTTFTSAHVGKRIVFADGFITTVTAFTNATTLTVADSRPQLPFYQNYMICNYYGELIHKEGTPTCICTTSLLYVNGGRYVQGPGSTLKSKTTSKTSSVEGTGISGIQWNGAVNGSQLIMNGTCPNPETTLTSDVNLGDSCLNVADSSQFAVGEYIAVYRDHSNDNFWSWCGRDQNDEGFIVHKVETGKIWIRLRVGVQDTAAGGMTIGTKTIQVNNPRKWQRNMKVWVDNELFTVDSINEDTGVLTMVENATVAHSTGASLYETGCQKRAIFDILQANANATSTYVTINNIMQFNVGDQILFGFNPEVATVSSIDWNNKRLNFSPALTKNHTYMEFIYKNDNVSHQTGDKVYKIATIVTSQANSGTNQIIVANASMLDIGDTICIEGSARAYTNSIEANITGKTGNTLTLSANLASTAYYGYLVSKLNRDCVVTATNEADDLCRPMFYATSGSTGYYGRKLVLRYVEIKHWGNNYGGTYGVCIRSDFNRYDCEREMRGCSIHDGWNWDPGGIWSYTAHYIIYRNNVIHRSHSGLRLYDTYGASMFNNISMSSFWSSFRYENTYSFTMMQYNIGLNSSTYAIYYTTDYTSVFTESQNLFKHVERALYFANTSTGAQYGSFMKNRFEDVYYKHHYVEGTRIMVQDCHVDWATPNSSGNISSGYANSEERGLNGGAIIVVNKDFIRGHFEIHLAGGWLERDDTIHMGNGWSYKGTPNASDRDARLNQMVYVKYDVPVTVTAYMRKNSTYNGTYLPRIVAKGRYLGYVYSEMVNINDQWVKVQLNFTPPRSEMIEVGVGGRGTAGNFWIDPRVLITTIDVPLINGPYSVNLMFGLEQIYDSDPNIILGNTKLGG